MDDQLQPIPTLLGNLVDAMKRIARALEGSDAEDPLASIAGSLEAINEKLDHIKGGGETTGYIRTLDLSE